jgi:hypothetical protein
MRRPRSLSLAVVLGALTLLATAAGCHQDGCVGGDDGQCVPPAACPALVYQACTAPKLRVEQIGPDDPERVAGPKALAAEGDYLLENDLVRVVLDAPDHPHFIGPSGGAILDLAPLGQSLGDQTNAIYHAAGVLPRDAVHYETAAILDSQVDASASGAFAAVIFRGHLESDPHITVVTRYELRPCEPGVRVRSDLYNGASEPNTLFLADGFFWGDNGLAPFVPGPGLGFLEPNLDLQHLDQAWRQWPFLAARSQAPPDTAYAAIACDRSQSAGFNSSSLTASGVPLEVTQPGDGFHFERFILAEPGPGLAPAVAEALHVRTLVHGDPPAVTVSGHVVANGASVDPRSGSAASLLFYEPAAGPNVDDPTRITPWNEVVPASDGTFQVALPPNRSYRVQPYAFGLPAAPAASFAVAGSDVSIGDLSITASAQLMVTVESSPGVPVTYAELVLVPVAPPAAGAVGPTLYSLFPGCAPLLGPPDAGSPACNRALITKDSKGSLTLAVPPGQYYVYATRGPFASLDRAEVTLAPGTSASVTLQVESLASQILPSGVVSGDFHVHGGASFDSEIPDLERVVSFLATGVDVIIATDHNVVTNYASTLATLGATSSIVIIPGVEQTPNILWYDVPGDKFPKTLGHFNFWPLVPDFLQTRNGAPWPELREPGQMMDDMDAVFANPTTAVRQLNHPYLLDKLGRDQGYPRAIGYDPTTPIPATPTAGFTFAANALARTPPDPAGGPGRYRNIDWDVEEVMTGASRADWLRYRALWFSLLNQGFKRVGTANSDSHSLSVERIGYPRNLIWGGHDQGTFDVDSFDADVLAGHVEGTNGPVLDVTIDDGPATIYRPGVAPIAVGSGAGLNVSIAAAPWIPVDELRVFVNGKLVMQKDISGSFSQGDRFGTQPGRYSPQRFVLSTLLPPKGDAWIVVEAGLHQDTPPDTDGDGLPDLPDADVPVRPQSPDDPQFDLQAIAPGVWPTAFSNPFFLDLDGGGWTAPGLQ